MDSLRRLRLGFVGAVLLTGLAWLAGARCFAPMQADQNFARKPDAPVETPVRSPAELEDHGSQHWRELSQPSASPERESERTRWLEAFAAQDPRRALAWAAAETDSALRNDFLQAALRGWGAINPEAAVAWARVQDLLDQGQAIAAVFHGVVHNPDLACRFAEQLTAQDPARAGDYDSYLIAALNRTGAFDRAAAVAAESPEEYRTDLLNAAYAGWGAIAPLEALSTIGQLTDPATKALAFDATVSRWAQHDPKAVIAYALEIQPGHEKTFALSVALRAWAETDLVAAAAWMSRRDGAPELDQGAAVVAVLPDALQLPQFATTVAENISDTRLRTRVLATIVQQWASVDPVAARAYVEHSPSIRPEDRMAVRAAFTPDFNPVTLLP